MLMKIKVGKSRNHECYHATLTSVHCEVNNRLSIRYVISRHLKKLFPRLSFKKFYYSLFSTPIIF